jgi:hypothetical protein
MGPLQCGGDLRPRQPSRAAGLGCLGQQLQDLGESEVVVGLQGCWEELPQAGAQPLTSALPFTDADVPFLALLQQRLDAEIAEVTRDSGGSYADIYNASLQHSACSPESTRWVESVVPGGGGTNVLHSSPAGTAAMATTLAPTATRLLTHDQRN